MRAAPQALTRRADLTKEMPRRAVPEEPVLVGRPVPALLVRAALGVVETQRVEVELRQARALQAQPGWPAQLIE
jgi:hypothetical protein